MKNTDSDYEALRTSCIRKYSKLYNDTLTFDLCKVPREIRLRLINDPVYVAETKSARASLFEGQIDLLDSVIHGDYAGEEPKDQSQTILKALEMKQRLLLQDLSENTSDADALNVTFTGMTQKAFSSFDTVSVVEGSNSDFDLGADFNAGTDDEDSFEARMKAQVKEKLSKLNETKD